MVHGIHAEKLWTSQLCPAEKDYIQDRSYSPVKSVLDLKINVFLPERFLAHPEPDSLGRAGGKALGFHLELSSGGSHVEKGLCFFSTAVCLVPRDIGAQFPFPSVQVSGNSLLHQVFHGFPCRSTFPSGNYEGYQLAWPFSWSSDYAPHLFVWVRLVSSTRHWVLESHLASVFDQVVIMCKQLSYSGPLSFHF